MADIQTGRFGRLLQSVFNLKQRMTLGQTMPDVLPVFSLDNTQPEMKLHVGETLCSAFVLQVAVAAQNGRCALQMPLSSGRVAIVDEVAIWSAAAAEYRLHLTAGVFGSDGGTLEQYCDTRLSGRPVCTTRVNSAAGALGGALASYAAPANQSILIKEPFVLGNGFLTGASVATALVVECENVNQAFNVSFRWRERVLEPQENTPS